MNCDARHSSETTVFGKTYDCHRSRSLKE